MTDRTKQALVDLTDNLKHINDGGFDPNPFECEFIRHTTRSIIKSVIMADESPEDAETYNNKADVLNESLTKHIKMCEKSPFYKIAE